MILSRKQRFGAYLLFGLAFAAWLTVALWPSKDTQLPDPQTHTRRTWEQRKDSMRRADSIRHAEWVREREQRFDSFHVADSMRWDEWKRERQQQYDSVHLADSLWRDSVGFRFPRHAKKDTILDLNRCDTAELQLIRGIGKHTALQIVRYREQLGGFCSPSQLLDEPFSKYHLDTLLAHFTADTADVQTIPVNSCSTERLQRHPYLRFSQAKAIYTLRRQRTRLSSIDDLRALQELTEADLERIAPYLSFE